MPRSIGGRAFSEGEDYRGNYCLSRRSAPQFPDDYTHVANVEAESPGEAVRLTTDAGNAHSREAAPWEKNEGVQALVTTPRDTAAADVIVDPHWKVHRFQGEGFTEIPLPKEAPPYSPGVRPTVDLSGGAAEQVTLSTTDREYWDEIVSIRDSADYLRRHGHQFFLGRPEGSFNTNDHSFIEFHDGRLTYGTCWRPGREIPPEYVDRLPDNGEFIKRDEYLGLAAMKGPESQALHPVVQDPPLEHARSQIREITHGDSGTVAFVTFFVPPDIDCHTPGSNRWSDLPETAKLFALERRVSWKGIGFTDKLELIEKHVDFSQVSPRDRQRALGRDWLARKAFDRSLVESASRARTREAAQRSGPAEPDVNGARPDNPERGRARNKKRRGR
jgi:hypothetical protein